MNAFIYRLFTPGTGRPSYKRYTAAINTHSLLSLGDTSIPIFNSAFNYVPVVASQHFFKLYLCRSVYITRCFIR